MEVVFTTCYLGKLASTDPKKKRRRRRGKNWGSFPGKREIFRGVSHLQKATAFSKCTPRHPAKEQQILEGRGGGAKRLFRTSLPFGPALECLRKDASGKLWQA